MKNRVIPFIILFFTVITGYPQPVKSEADSLARLLALSTREDSARVKLLLNYSRCFVPDNIDTTLLLSQQALKISQKINFSYGVIRGLNSIAVCYWYQNNPEKAIHTLQQALLKAIEDKNADLESLISNNLGVYYGKLGVSDSALKYNKMAVAAGKKLTSKSRYIKSLADLGMCYFNTGSYVEALECILESKNYYDSSHMLYELEISDLRLGLIFYSIGDFNKSISNFRQGLQINDSVKNANLEMSLLQNIGLLYFEVNKNFDSAKFYLNKSLHMAQATNNQEVRLSALTNLGNIAMDENDFKEAVLKYDQAFEIPLVLSRNQERAALLVNMGKAYMHLGDLVRAEKFASQGIKLAQEQKFISYERTACKIMGDIEAKKKNYKAAFEYYVRYSTLQDTLGSAEMKHKMAEVVFQNTLNQKDNENLILQKDNEINRQTIRNQWVLILGAGLILLLVVLLLAVIIRNNRRQRLMNVVLGHKNRELKELNLTKDKFFSIIAHDLKSPFNGLLGLLGELDENYDGLDETAKRNIIGSLKRSSHNAYNLLVNLLDWAQSQRGHITCTPQYISINEVAKEVLIVLSARAAAKNHHLVSEIDAETRIYSDPRIIRAMLLNLVNNAIKFTPIGGTITLRTFRTGDFLRIEVIDSGIGIPASQVKNLFRIDAQFKRRGTENEPGTGLGLVMCREFAAILGGEIGVDSEEGKGCVFYFTIGLPAGSQPEVSPAF